MRVFRIERERYLHEVLSGRGAALSDGARWNSFGTPMVYSSEHRALALLEITVHLDWSADLPNDRFLVQLDIPDALPILELPLGDLPKGWDSYPPSAITRRWGDAFIREAQYAVAKVPSALVPDTYNYLIHPFHTQSSAITVVDYVPLRLDARLRQT